MNSDIKSETILPEDNVSAIEVSKNPKFHGRMKHVDMCHHIVRDVVENGQLLL